MNGTFARSTISGLGGLRQLLKAGVDRLGACDVEAAVKHDVGQPVRRVSHFHFHLRTVPDRSVDFGETSNRA